VHAVDLFQRLRDSAPHSCAQGGTRRSVCQFCTWRARALVSPASPETP
jgi:hypothetical protein